MGVGWGRGGGVTMKKGRAGQRVERAIEMRGGSGTGARRGRDGRSACRRACGRAAQTGSGTEAESRGLRCERGTPAMEKAVAWSFVGTPERAKVVSPLGGSRQGRRRNYLPLRMIFDALLGPSVSESSRSLPDTAKGGHAFDLRVFPAQMEQREAVQ